MTEQYTPKLGQLASDADLRDAIHIAVAPVVAGCPIRPGSHVHLNEAGEAVWGHPDDGNTIGIADPFLRTPIERGQRFFLLLYPGTITGLRHMWRHPAFRPKVPGVE